MTMTMLKPIKEYMTPQPMTTRKDVLISEARRTMAVRSIHHLPVVEDEELVGILSTRDVDRVLTLLGDASGTVTVSEAMTGHPFTCGPEAQLHAVAREMLAYKCGTAIVVERECPSRVVGIFTVNDALRVIAGLGEPHGENE